MSRMSWKTLVRGMALGAILAAGVGCRDLGTGPAGAIPTTILLDQSVVQMGSLGSEVVVRALVLDQFGQEVSGTPLIWFVDDPSVATVESGNRILARRNGETTVQVVVDPASARTRGAPSGFYSGVPSAQARVVVRQEVGGFTFPEASSSTLWAAGQRRQMAVEILDPLGSPFERAIQVRWESANPNIAEVSPEGRLVARDDGLAQIRAVTDEGAGATNVQVTTRFTFSACVSSSASRLQANLGGGAPAESCGNTQLRAVMPDSIGGGG
jgi:hypothetical protein